MDRKGKGVNRKIEAELNESTNLSCSHIKEAFYLFTTVDRGAALGVLTQDWGISSNQGLICLNCWAQFPEDSLNALKL